MRFRGTAAAVTAILATLALVAVPAQASITLGQTSDNSLTFFSLGPSTEVETASEAALSYTVPPGGGVITSWSNRAESLDQGQIKLKIYRPSGQANSFSVVAESAAETITPNQLNTYPAHIPVEAGDLLGMTRTARTAASVFFFSMAPGDMAAQLQGADDPPGSSTVFSPAQSGLRLNLSAILRQRPAVSSVEPSSGPIAGGTQVTINGSDFTDASVVSFGNAPVTTFTVESEGRITATSPPGAPGAADVAVTTPLGLSPSTSADRFQYTACLVPRLKGKTLKVSRKKLREADCKVGEVKRLRAPAARSGRVVKQNPRPGEALVPGAQVNLGLGR
jgi:hypothetical protein